MALNLPVMTVYLLNHTVFPTVEFLRSFISEENIQADGFRESIDASPLDIDL